MSVAIISEQNKALSARVATLEQPTLQTLVDHSCNVLINVFLGHLIYISLAWIGVIGELTNERGLGETAA